MTPSQSSAQKERNSSIVRHARLATMLPCLRVLGCGRLSCRMPISTLFHLPLFGSEDRTMVVMKLEGTELRWRGWKRRR